MSRAVELESLDGVVLRGELRPGGPYWALLVHDRGCDLDSLSPLADALEREQFSVLSVDLRGHGLSEGSWAPEGGARDVAAALAWMRAEGAAQIFAVAAGEAARPLLASAGPGGPAAAVLLGPRLDPDGELELVRRFTGPRLFLTGFGDPEEEARTRKLFDACIGPRLLVQLPTSERGHGLLHGPCAAQALSHSVGYLAQNRIDIEHAA